MISIAILLILWNHIPIRWRSLTVHKFVSHNQNQKKKKKTWLSLLPFFYMSQMVKLCDCCIHVGLWKIKAINSTNNKLSSSQYFRELNAEAYLMIGLGTIDEERWYLVFQLYSTWRFPLDFLSWWGGRERSRNYA